MVDTYKIEETVDVEPYNKQKFPKEVVDAYNVFVEAEKAFESAKKKHEPKAPFVEGELVMFDRWNEGVWRSGVIAHIRYDPYTNNRTFGAWRVSIRMLKKDFTDSNRRLAWIKVDGNFPIKRVVKVEGNHS